MAPPAMDARRGGRPGCGCAEEVTPLAAAARRDGPSGHGRAGCGPVGRGRTEDGVPLATDAQVDVHVCRGRAGMLGRWFYRPWTRWGRGPIGRGRAGMWSRWPWTWCGGRGPVGPVGRDEGEDDCDMLSTTEKNSNNYECLTYTNKDKTIKRQYEGAAYPGRNFS